MAWNRKDLLDIESLNQEEIEMILDSAVAYKEVFTRSIKKVPTLRGKTVVNLFYEPSTRTRTSFELAAKRLSADIVNIAVDRSSVVKGESLLDTLRTMEAMKADMVIIRHSCSGAPHFLASRSDASIINAGDGMHEHPTQALLDAFSMKEVKGRIKGLTVVIVGDILHSRVARSNIWCLNKLGATVRVVGPSTLIPREVERLGVKVFYELEEALQGADVVNILRIQKERMQRALFPTVREYSHIFGVTLERLRAAKPDVTIMHPGPMNQGVEIDAAVVEDPRTIIREQVTNGVAVRMAIMVLLGMYRGVADEDSSESQ